MAFLVGDMLEWILLVFGLMIRCPTDCIRCLHIYENLWMFRGLQQDSTNNKNSNLQENSPTLETIGRNISSPSRYKSPIGFLFKRIFSALFICCLFNITQFGMYILAGWDSYNLRKMNASLIQEDIISEDTSITKTQINYVCPN
jgi:hypothetical protein